jgi:hypothetical protein
MAEEMAKAAACQETRRTGRPTENDSEPARKREVMKAPEPVTLAPESKESLRDEVALDSDGGESKSAASGFDFRESMYEAVAEYFPKIIKGLMVGIEKGNASGAKVLFDALAKLAANPGKVEHQKEVGVIFTDLVGPDFDWEKGQIAGPHELTETAEAGIDVGSGDREPE